MNLWGIIKGILIQDETDRTKQISVEVDPTATTATKTTIKSAQTGDQTITLPDATDTLVGKQTTDNLENKTIDGTSATGTNTVTIDASDAVYDNSTSGLTATDLQAATDEVEGRVDVAEQAITDHLSDTVDAHDASAISYDNSTSGLTATEVQAATDEIEGRLDTAETNISGKANTDLSNLSSTAINEILKFGPAIVGELSTADNGAGDSENLIIKTGSATGTQGQILLQDGTEGNIGDVWTSTGLNGEGEWSAAGAGGANTTLSNLTSPTTVNQDLLPTNATINLGASGPTDRWNTSHIDTGTFYTVITVGGSQNIIKPTTTPSGATNVFSHYSGNVSTKVGLFTGSVGANTGAVHIESGNSTIAGNTGLINVKTGDATSGDSGDVNIETGSASGTRGAITFKDGSEGNTGEVWTSKGTNGEGNWEPLVIPFSPNVKIGAAENLAIGLTGSVTNISQSDGTALAPASAGYIHMSDFAGLGAKVKIPVEANANFIDATSASDIIGEGFGTTSGIAWGNDMPFYLYAVNSDNTASGLLFAISRNPVAKVTTNSFAYKGNPALSNSERTFFYLTSSSPSATHLGKPCVRIGGIRMTKDASDDWTVQNVLPDEGICTEPHVNKSFEFPLNCNGANPTSHFKSFGGVASEVPQWTGPASAVYGYQVQLNGVINCVFETSNGTLTNGSAAETLKLVLPCLPVASIGGDTNHTYHISSGRAIYGISNTPSVCSLQISTNTTYDAYVYGTANYVPLSSNGFSGAANELMLSWSYKAYE